MSVHISKREDNLSGPGGGAVTSGVARKVTTTSDGSACGVPSQKQRDAPAANDDDDDADAYREAGIRLLLLERSRLTERRERFEPELEELEERSEERSEGSRERFEEGQELQERFSLELSREGQELQEEQVLQERSEGGENRSGDSQEPEEHSAATSDDVIKDISGGYQYTRTIKYSSCMFSAVFLFANHVPSSAVLCSIDAIFKDKSRLIVGSTS